VALAVAWTPATSASASPSIPNKRPAFRFVYRIRDEACFMTQPFRHEKWNRVNSQ
jgi:hypothetical protein